MNWSNSFRDFLPDNNELRIILKIMDFPMCTFPFARFWHPRVTLCLLLGLLAGVGTPAQGHDLDGIEELKQVQEKVKSVVRQKMNVVVSVTDGIGFGSGVVVSEDGLVLTAGHVLLTGGSNFRVIFPDGREAKAEAWGRNLNVDAGMVRITEAGPWDHAELGDSSTLEKGDWCICMGHSGGYELGRRPPVRAGRIVDFEPDQLVTDCALIGGDSGGPLFDLQGRVIGIHSSIGSSVAENRHVAIATFRKHWDRMLDGERWGQLPELAGKDEAEPKAGSRPSLGIRLDRAADLAKILLVHPAGAAETAGLRAGDVILVFDSIFINSAEHLIDLIAARSPGDALKLTIQRGRSGNRTGCNAGTALTWRDMDCPRRAGPPASVVAARSGMSYQQGWMECERDSTAGDSHAGLWRLA